MSAAVMSNPMVFDSSENAEHKMETTYGAGLEKLHMWYFLCKKVTVT